MGNPTCRAAEALSPVTSTGRRGDDCSDDAASVPMGSDGRTRVAAEAVRVVDDGAEARERGRRLSEEHDRTTPGAIGLLPCDEDGSDAGKLTTTRPRGRKAAGPRDR